LRGIAENEQGADDYRFRARFGQSAKSPADRRPGVDDIVDNRDALALYERGDRQRQTIGDGI
jgi:hypothetical protein